MRAYCSHCAYPKTTCLCSHIRRIPNSIPIHVIQDPKETKHALNTIHIARLCLENIRIHDVSITEEEIQQILQGGALMFPSQTSTTLPPNHTGPLFFLDATWPKAMKIYLSNPILHSIPNYHLPNPRQSSYHIRKTSRTNALSSLEAIGQSLEFLDAETAEIKPLYDAFHARIAMQIQHIPKEIFHKNYPI